MVQFNSQKKEILLKIVYYGTGLSGKTTNLKSLHKFVTTQTDSELFSVNTMEDRTLFFDLMPIDIEAAGRKIKFQVYTVPGQVHYDSTRRIILAGADGVVFIADSDADKIKENIEALNNLYKNLNANRLDIKTIPIAFQYNKRDLPNITPFEVIDRKLNFRQAPSFEGIATEGKGVVETFKSVALDVVKNIVTKYKLVKSEADIKTVLNDVTDSLEKLLKTDSKDSDILESKDLEDTNTKIIYEGKEGQVSETEVLEKALKATEETATILNKTKILKKKLERRNKELAALLKENTFIKNFLQSLFHHAGLPIFTFSIKGKITNWNSLCEKLFSYTTKEAKGLYFSELVPEKNILDIQTILSSVISSKKPMSAFVTLLDKHQVEKTYNCIFSPVEDDNSTVVSISVIIHYIEDTLNKQLTLSEGNVLSIKDLVNKVVGNFSSILLNDNIILKNNIFEENRAVEIEEKKLYKVINSIIRNSIKSFDENCEKKEIAITLNSSDEEKLVLNIRDTGVGISSEVIEKINQSEEFSKKDLKKDNLTLSQCKFLLKENNGDMKILGRKGKGSVISLILPKGKNTLVNTSVQQELNRIFKGKSILFLDKKESDAFNKFNLQFKIDKAKYGNEGILLLNQNTYDFIIVDFNMPEFSGFQFYEWILDEKPHLCESLIFLVNKEMEEKTMKFLEEKKLKYIVRPISGEKLISQLEK